MGCQEILCRHSQKMEPIDFCDQLTSSSNIMRLTFLAFMKCLNNYWTECYDILVYTIMSPLRMHYFEQLWFDSLTFI